MIKKFDPARPGHDARWMLISRQISVLRKKIIRQKSQPQIIKCWMQNLQSIFLLAWQLRLASQNFIFAVFHQYLFNQEEFFKSENGIRKVLKMPFEMSQGFLDFNNFYPQNQQKTHFSAIFQSVSIEYLFSQKDFFLSEISIEKVFKIPFKIVYSFSDLVKYSWVK